MKDIIGINRARSIGAILFAMRKGAHSSNKICAGRAGCENELELLKAAGYVAKNGDRYVLLVPVFADEDKAFVQSVLQESRMITSDWLKQNYQPMRADLAGLSALQQGVPYPVLFTQIWHELFGRTTRDLTVSGVIEDPRSKGAMWNGSIPVVWSDSVYRFDWQ